MMFLILLLACGLGKSTPEVCDAYLDCAGDVAPGATEELELAFGDKGSCWTSGSWVATDCMKACARNLAHLAVGNPDVEECQSEDGCTRAMTKVAACTGEAPDLSTCPTVNLLDDWHECVEEGLADTCDWDAVAECERPDDAPVPIGPASVAGDWSVTPMVLLSDDCELGLSPPLGVQGWMLPEGAGVVWLWEHAGRPVTLGCDGPASTFTCESERDGWAFEAEVTLSSPEAGIVDLWLTSSECAWHGLVSVEHLGG